MSTEFLEHLAACVRDMVTLAKFRKLVHLFLSTCLLLPLRLYELSEYYARLSDPYQMLDLLAFGHSRGVTRTRI